MLWELFPVNERMRFQELKYEQNGWFITNDLRVLGNNVKCVSFAYIMCWGICHWEVKSQLSITTQTPRHKVCWNKTQKS